MRRSLETLSRVMLGAVLGLSLIGFASVATGGPGGGGGEEGPPVRQCNCDYSGNPSPLTCTACNAAQHGNTCFINSGCSQNNTACVIQCWCQDTPSYGCR